MAKVIAYQYEARGIKQSITNQDQLTEAIKRTNQEVRKSDFGSEALEKATKQQAELKNAQEAVRREAKIQQRELVVAADKGRGSYRALQAELKNAEETFKDLSREERRTAQGLELSARIRDIREELRELNAEIGKPGLRGALTEVFGSIGGIDLASFATIGGAITGIAAAAGQAIEFVGELTVRFRTLRGEISQLVEGTDEELDSFTARIAAIADTFDESEEEILQAANTVSERLGIPFEEALTRIEEGFIAGSNANNEFLDSLREYPGFFAEAGISADAFFQILNQQATQGIFSDKGVDAIKEATLSLREMPQATRDAVNAIGLDSQRLQQLIAEEGIGAGIAEVSRRLNEIDQNAPEFGQAIADIFKGAGEDAGVEFLLSLQSINEETGSLIDQASEYQIEQQKNLEINQRFAEVQNQVARELGGTSSGFARFTTQLKTGLLEVLLFLIGRFRTFLGFMRPIGQALLRLGEALGLFTEQGERTQRLMNIINAVLEAQEFLWEITGKAIGFVIDQVAKFVENIVSALEFLGILDRNAQQAAQSTEELADKQSDAAKSAAEQEKATEAAKRSVSTLADETERYAKAADMAAVATDQFAKGSIAALRKEVADLQQELEQADPDDVQGILSKLVGAEQALEEAEAARQRLRQRLVEGRFETLQPLQETANLEVDIENRKIDEIIEANRRKNELLLIEEQNRLAQVQEIQETIFDNLTTAISALDQANSARINREIAAVEDRYRKEIVLAEGNKDRQEQLEKELEAETAKLRKKEFEDQKRFQTALALTSLAQGIISILSAPSVIPDPFGSVFKAIQIGVLTAVTAAQISSIQSQQAKRGFLQELGKGDVLPTPSVKGIPITKGRFRGASHADPAGGIPIAVGGQLLMVEHGEFMDTDESGGVAIINRRSSEVFDKQLQSTRGVSFPGKRKYLSAINSYRHHGIKFAQEGAIIAPGAAAIAGATSQAPVTAVAKLDQESVDQIASATAVAVKEGAEVGVVLGMGEANREAERQDRLNSRTGLN